ncbi:uncharacterized protein LOC129731692 [Wyeomyia smithii]|uniref:uncharacterized protein LOC129731692 n=1 Tax=Wyeomyia smithii TaxID=174621 RepID=UPI0024680C10|nr:uncharacterized protein LOC129731692 [Wyeomyia smithii]
MKAVNQLSDDKQNVSPPDDMLPEAKKRSGTIEGMDGFSFEITILTLVLHRAKEKKLSSFRMAANMEGIGACDDVVFLDYSEPRWGLFLQAKHTKKSITHETLMQRTGDFSLSKYLDSFQKVKSKFKGINVTCILYSTGGFDRKLSMIENDMNRSSIFRDRAYNLDDLISTGTRGTKFQLSKESYEDSLMEVAAEPRIQNLANKVIELAFNENGLLDNSVDEYQFLLAKEVIDIKTKEIKPDFFEKTEPLWLLFRETMEKKILLESRSILEPSKKIELLEDIIETQSVESISKVIKLEIRYKPDRERLELITKSQKWPQQFRKKVSEIEKRFETLPFKKATIDHAFELAGIIRLKSLKFEHLPKNFGEIDSVSWEDNEQLVELVAQFKKVIDSTEVRLSQLLVGVKMNRIFGLVDSLLIMDRESKSFKFNLNSEKWEPFFKVFDQDSKRIENVRFVNDVIGFTLTNNIDRELVNEFLEYLWIYVEQPKVDELKKELSIEISKNCCGFADLHLNSEDDSILRYVHKQVQQWWKNPNGGWLTNDHQFFEEAILTILNGLFNERNQSYKALKFGSEAMNDLKPDCFAKGVFNIVTKHSLIVSSKLSQLYEEQTNCYFIDWDIVKSRGCINNLKKVIESYVHNSKDKSSKIIIVIDSNADFTLDCSSLTKCILISRNKILQNTITDNLNGLVDLTLESQDRILTNGTINFQNEKVSLKQLITTEELKRAIDTTTLSMLLATNVISIGKTPATFIAEGVAKFFIPRIFQRQASDRTLTEVNNLVPDFKQENNKLSPVELLIAEPGMGKSTIFSFMAKAMKHKNPTFWVSNLCLHDHSGVFLKWLKTKNNNDQEVMQRFLFDALRSVPTSKTSRVESILVGPALLEKEIFYHLYREKTNYYIP